MHTDACVFSVFFAGNMNTGPEEGFLFKKETEAIIGGAFEVLNTLGHGLLEKPYEGALCVELGLRGIPFKQQPRYEVP